MPSPSSLLKLPNTVLPQTPTIADGKVSGFVGKTVYTAKHCVLKSNRTQNINFRFWILLRRLDQIEIFVSRIHQSACKWQNASETKIFQFRHESGKSSHRAFSLNKPAEPEIYSAAPTGSVPQNICSSGTFFLAGRCRKNNSLWKESVAGKKIIQGVRGDLKSRIAAMGYLW